MKPCKFTFDDGPVWNGYAHGSKWNGFDNVAVTSEVRDRMVQYFDEYGDHETAQAIWDIDAMDNGMVSLGWGYTTYIVPATRYVVRDRATKGCDFLVWGDDDPEAAAESIRQALADGLDVELVTMPANDMDKFTAKLIG